MISIKERGELLNLRFPTIKTYHINKIKNAKQYSIYGARMKFETRRHVCYYNWRYYYEVNIDKTHYLFVVTLEYKNRYGKMVEGVMRFPFMHHYHEYMETPHYLEQHLKDSSKKGWINKRCKIK
jgi:hypothetical protein